MNFGYVTVNGVNSNNYITAHSGVDSQLYPITYLIRLKCSTYINVFSQRLPSLQKVRELPWHLCVLQSNRYQMLSVFHPDFRRILPAQKLFPKLLLLIIRPEKSSRISYYICIQEIFSVFLLLILPSHSQKKRTHFSHVSMPLHH